MLHVKQVLLFVQKFVHYKDSLPNVLLHYFLENNKLHNHNTCKCTDRHMTLNYTTYGHKSILHKGCKLWNEMPADLKVMQSIAAFNRSVYQYIFSLLSN